MTTEAEIAAGHALYEDGCKTYAASDLPWDCLDEDAKQRWIKRGMTIVRAYQRAAWRGITDDDRLGRTVFAFSWKYKNESTWRGPFTFPGNCLPLADDNREFLIRDLLPLPESKS